MIKKAFSSHFYLLSCLLLLVVALIVDEVVFSDQKRRVDPKVQISQNLWPALDQMDQRLDDLSDKVIVDLNRVFNRFEKDDLYPYFIFEDQELVYWSTNRFVPKYGTFDGSYLYKFLTLKNGQYIVKRRVVNSARNTIVEIYQLYPLYSDIPISDAFRENGLNADIFGFSDYNLKANQVTEVDHHVFSREGIFLFSFEGTDAMKISYPLYSSLILVVYILVIYLFVRSAFQYARVLDRADRPYIGILTLSLFMVVLRLVMIQFQFPLSVIELGVFRPDHFASSWWQPSIGDYVLNQTAILAITTFGFLTYTKRQESKERTSGANVLLLTVLSLASVFYFRLELQSLLENSQWSLDVANDIGLSPFRLISYGLLFINGLVCFLLGQLLSRELALLSNDKGVALILAGLAIVSALLYGVTRQEEFFLTGTWFAYLLLVNRMNLSAQIYSVNYSTFLYFFLASGFVALISTHILMRHVRILDREEKISLASELVTDNDVTAEFLLAQAYESIQSDILIQNNLTNPFSSKQVIRSKIRRSFLGEYFDKYDIEILLFNGSGSAINNPLVLDYQELEAVYAKPEYTTEFDHLYFLNEDLLSQYYLFTEVQRYNTTIGYVVVKLDRREQLNNSILPRLLLEESRSAASIAHFDYAVYQDDNLMQSFGDYNYERDFALNSHDRETLFNEGVTEDSHHHMAVNGKEGEFFVISSKLYPIRYVITNFATFFLSLVAVIILIFLVSALFYRNRRKGVSISAKIQILLNIAFFLPLIIVSIVVLRLVNNTVRKNIEAEYLEITESAGNNLAATLSQFLENRNENNEALERRVFEISQYARADINIFNTNGRLVATNQRLIFDNDILSSFANPEAMASVLERGNSKQLFEEYLGELSYQATYFGIRSGNDSQLLGLLSMPFFESQDRLKAQQTDIVSNILNAFTFIFILFVILSYYASSILTYPFKFLTERIKTITLSRYNEPLEWAANDEIGLMVKEYNRMLVNLEKSKKALALSEKESAWREMAQQVAHEIKNPLTPMKLKLQHLKRVLSDGRETLGQDYNKPIDSLLNQVEALSDIATSFSSFAKMPIPLSERLDMADVLKKATRLFSADEVTIKSNIPRNPVWIEGDKNLLGRIFNNLILNAMQSVPEGKEPIIEVELELTMTRARVTVTDNGEGIPDDIKEKIFIPKFSTKERGSGIGLAIAKRGVEHAGGSIWFESHSGEGSTFFIEFPLMD